MCECHYRAHSPLLPVLSVTGLFFSDPGDGVSVLIEKLLSSASQDVFLVACVWLVTCSVPV